MLSAASFSSLPFLSCSPGLPSLPTFGAPFSYGVTFIHYSQSKFGVVTEQSEAQDLCLFVFSHKKGHCKFIWKSHC